MSRQDDIDKILRIIDKQCKVSSLEGDGTYSSMYMLSNPKQLAEALVDNKDPVRSKDGFELDLSKTRQELEVEDISIKPINYKE